MKERRRMQTLESRYYCLSLLTLPSSPTHKRTAVEALTACTCLALLSCSPREREVFRCSVGFWDRRTQIIGALNLTLPLIFTLGYWDTYEASRI